MNVLSLFDGISCARVALDRAGIRVDRYLASEIKPHAIKIAQAMFPSTEQLGDVTKIDFSTFPPIDLIVFGSPCQDLSCANNEQKGLEGERSGLFFKAVEAIRVCKPRWFLMENVASMKKSEEEKISRTLGEFYTNDMFGIYCEPVRINSSLVSAQMRDRLYWCNWPVSQPVDRHIMLQDVLEEDGEALMDKSYSLKPLLTLPHLGYSEEDGERIFNNNFTPVQKKAYAVKTSPYKRDGHRSYHLIQIGNIDAGKGAENNSIWSRVYDMQGKACNQNANGGGAGAKTGLYRIGENVRKLTPRECCRLQTYDERVFDYFTIDRRTKKERVLNELIGVSNIEGNKYIPPDKPYMSKSAWYNVFGDSFTVDVIVHILKCNMDLMAIATRGWRNS